MKSVKKSSGFMLAQALEALGLKDAFDPERAGLLRHGRESALALPQRGAAQGL
jgi:hypothetical protein